MGKETGNGLLIFHAALRSRNRKDTIYTMKTSLLSLCLAVGICAAMPAALAQDATDSAASPAAGQKVSKKAKKKAVTIKPGKANKAIGKLRTVNGVKPNRKALYYIVFQSASWCGACNAEMPNIAKAYEEMKADGGLVEVVLASSDHDAPAANGFLNKYNAKFPTILKADASKIPGFKVAGGIPWAQVIDANGNVVEDSHAGQIISQWHKYEDMAKQKQAEAEQKALAKA